MNLLVIAAATVLIFSACSSGTESFEDLDSLRVALRREGFACENFKQRSPSRLVAKRATCEVNGSSITLYLFDSSTQLKRWKPIGGAFGHVVVGPNWAVASQDKATMEHLRKKLQASVER